MVLLFLSLLEKGERGRQDSRERLKKAERECPSGAGEESIYAMLEPSIT